MRDEQRPRDGQGKPIRNIRTEWQEIILVCRKCAKRLDGGFGPDGDRPLAKALRQELKQAGLKAKGRKAEIAVVETDCFGICPKRATMAVRAATPGRSVMVPAGTEPAEVLAALGIEMPARDR